MSKQKEFSKERNRLNDLVLEKGTLNTKRFFNIDTNTYKDGALSAKMKELMGLVASMVLRCDDCISYHTIEVHSRGLSQEEFTEACDVALVVGGSIVIPHLRRAYDLWAELEKNA